MKQQGFVNKVFAQLVESVPRLPSSPGNTVTTEGIVKSFNEFIKLVCVANDLHSENFSIPEDKRLRIVEEFPGELITRINSDNFDGNVDTTTLHDLRVVTYISSEKPASVGAHRVNEEGVRNIKERLIDIIPDPDYTGYSIARFGKDIEATVTFKVWGLSMYDVRERAKLLRDVMKLNTWFFKHKGLREMVWLGSNEWEEWDGSNIVKAKSEKYMIRFTEVTQTKEKNVEQLTIQIGVNTPETAHETAQGTTKGLNGVRVHLERDEFFIP